MRQNVILDTGPLVAFVNRRETAHQWAIEQWNTIELPFLTCEAVITEACFLLKKDRFESCLTISEKPGFLLVGGRSIHPV